MGGEPPLQLPEISVLELLRGNWTSFADNSPDNSVDDGFRAGPVTSHSGMIPRSRIAIRASKLAGENLCDFARDS